VSSNSHWPRTQYEYLGLEIGYFFIEFIPFESFSFSSSTFFHPTTLGGGVLHLEAVNLGLELDDLLLFLYEFHYEAMYLAGSTLAASFLWGGGDIQGQ